jgi:hypothetical protein
MFQRTLLSTLLTSGCVVCLLLVQDASSEHGQTSNDCASRPARADATAQLDALRLALDRVQALLDSSPPIPFDDVAREAHLLAELADGPGPNGPGEQPGVTWEREVRDTGLQLAMAAERREERRCAILVRELTHALHRTKCREQ